MLKTHGQCSKHVSLAFRLAFALILGGSGIAQTPPPKPDPLQQLLAENRPAEKKIRLHVTLLRVPMVDAAKSMLDDKGEAPLFWRTRLNEWKKAGRMESITDYRSEDEDMAERSPLAAGKFRFINQAMASHFWEWNQSAKEEKAPPPDPNQLLQDLSEEDCGNRFKTTLNMRHGWRQAAVGIELLHCPKPKSRPATTWPLPAFTAPRFLFRPWLLNAHAIFPVNEPFLLGAQMEPPHDGQVHTGHVIMAFGRVTLPEKSGFELEADKADFTPGKRVQTWTLAVDRAVFLPWIAKRRSEERDGKTLETWLAKSAARDGIELLATSAIPVEAGFSSRLLSTLSWEDASGFEPGGTLTEFRPLVCECDSYCLRHGIVVELGVPQVTETDLSRDPFAASPARRKPAKAWTVNLAINRPSGPARWQKWKSAMERDENDPHALEIAEAESGGDFQDDSAGTGESSQVLLTIPPGQVTLVSAGMKKDRVHVTFLRLVADAVPTMDAPKKQDDADAPDIQSPATTTTWIIETPVSWQSRLLGKDGLDLQALGRELLEAVNDGSASLAGLVSLVQNDGVRGAAHVTEPRIYFGGEYVNTAPAPQGIFFNTRNVGRESVGDMIKAETAGVGGGPHADMIFEMRSLGTPAWRHWGIWQPGVKGAGARNSGILRPVFPTSIVTGRVRLEPHTPQVIAVMRLSANGSTEEAPARLRWHVTRLDTPLSLPVSREVRPDQFAVEDDTLTLQAVVLKVAPAFALPADGDAAAAALLNGALAGDHEVLDLMTLPMVGGMTMTATTGHDLHFTSGRSSQPSEKHDDAFRVPAAMPEGTRYDDQVRFKNRIVGFHLSQLDGDGGWMIERDARVPEIITDTFPNVRLEWPDLRSGQDWEDVPRVTVSVQRPIFTIQNAEGRLPDAGKAVCKRLSDDAVLVIRSMR